MGMAASQARHLALVARQSNCEYEGQQINQSRLNLANESANLFTQMLGLQVPVPPSMQDFTKVQYSFSDGNSKTTMDSWNQLATPEEDFNYVVTYHYNSEVYTGSQKRMNDPQVQFSLTLPTNPQEYENQVLAIESKLKEITELQKAYDTAADNYKTQQKLAANLASYADTTSKTGIVDSEYDKDNDSYVVHKQQYNDDGYGLYTDGTNQYYKKEDGKYYSKDDSGTEIEFTGDLKTLKAVTNDFTYTSYKNIEDGTMKQAIGNAIEQLRAAGALPETFTADDAYYDTTNNVLAFKSDLDALISKGGSGTKTVLPSYYLTDSQVPEGVEVSSIESMQYEVDRLKGILDVSKANLDKAEAEYDMMSVPSYVGNCPLTPVSELTEQQIAEIQQIIKDMQAQGIDISITDCFNTLDGTYDNTTYKGGLYTFKQGGVTYFATYYDLAETANSGEGINHIDNQAKLQYYNASYVTTKIEKTEKALLQTDGSGRFNSIRLEDDSIVYTLETETIQDDDAYNDAMNQYYYQSAQYDKMIQDLNAKTSIIQQQDKQLELRLTQLDTERNALSKEIEAVSKVVKDNVDKSFKTFGG